MNNIKAGQSSNKDCMSRRGLLKSAGYVGAAALLVSGLRSKADAAVPSGTYPQVKIANIREIRSGRPIKFDYPLVGRKNILLDVGCAVESGVGPNNSIVAYSMFCSHLGCGVDMEWASGMLVCECHQTIYDPKQSGKIIEGPAPTNLPMVSLDIDGSTGDIYAVGVAGLIYGLRNNLLDGEEVGQDGQR